MKFAYQLFKNKEYIEIKLFLKIFQNNLSLAGYETKKIVVPPPDYTNYYIAICVCITIICFISSSLIAGGALATMR